MGFLDGARDSTCHALTSVNTPLHLSARRTHSPPEGLEAVTVAAIGEGTMASVAASPASADLSTTIATWVVEGETNPAPPSIILNKPASQVTLRDIKRFYYGEPTSADASSGSSSLRSTGPRGTFYFKISEDELGVARLRDSLCLSHDSICSREWIRSA